MCVCVCVCVTGAEQVGAAWRVISVFLHLAVFTECVKNRGSVSVSADGREHAVIEVQNPTGLYKGEKEHAWPEFFEIA